MTETDLILLNFQEIRRRSIALWEGLPENFHFWKPDEKAMTAIDMIRHVIGADYGWNIIINRGDMSSYQSPWENKPYQSVQEELDFALPYRQEFLKTVRSFSAEDLNTIEIIHPGTTIKRKLVDYLLRIGYHESVHAGQFLSYLRAMEVERPFIWD